MVLSKFGMDSILASIFHKVVSIRVLVQERFLKLIYDSNFYSNFDTTFAFLLKPSQTYKECFPKYQGSIKNQAFFIFSVFSNSCSLFTESFFIQRTIVEFH